MIRTLREAKRGDIGLRPLPRLTHRRPVSIPDGAQFLERSFTSRAGSRAYKLYIPRYQPRHRKRLIVMLHGCTQNPDDFALGTRMNDVAEELD